MSDIVREALRFAEARHGDQKYGENLPYIYHLNQVADLCVNLGLPETYQVIAALHDILEDTNADPQEIYERFGSFVLKTVNYLTRGNESYGDYIIRVSKNYAAKAIKVCDLLCNLENCIRNPEKYGSLIKRYQKALFILAMDGNIE